MEKLVNAFNPTAAAGVMCRDTISVGWDGGLYDCDFNQMLDLGLNRPAPGTMASKPAHLRDLLQWDPSGAGVRVADHCWGCTAGSGSSCGGALA
jgi:hypothetical protein